MSPMIQRSPEKIAELEEAINAVCEEIVEFVEKKWSETGCEPIDDDAISDLHVANFNWFANILNLYDRVDLGEALISDVEMRIASVAARRRMAERKEREKKVEKSARTATQAVVEDSYDPELLP